MTIHVLPGDAQLETFKETGIAGDIAVCRECLVDGPVDAADIPELWNMRAEFLDDKTGYPEKVVTEFEKLVNVPHGGEVNLWFEYELFCQVNMWFCLGLLRDSKALVYRVEPVLLSEDDRWMGFGRMDAGDLRQCFEGRRLFSDGDIALGAALWDAYSISDFQRLRDLSKTGSEGFPYLEDVCRAAAEKETRPKEVLDEISAEGFTGFGDIFTEFSKRASVYGFGDDQVRRLLESGQSS